MVDVTRQRGPDSGQLQDRATVLDRPSDAQMCSDELRSAQGGADRLGSAQNGPDQSTSTNGSDSMIESLLTSSCTPDNWRRPGDYELIEAWIY